MAGRNRKPNRTGQTEPNRFTLEAAGTGCGKKPNRTGPSHDASARRRPNHVESGEQTIRTEPILFSKSPELKRIEPNRFLPAMVGNEGGSNICKLSCLPYRCLWNNHSFCKSLCPATQHQKLLPSPWFGTLKAGRPTFLFLRRSVFLVTFSQTPVGPADCNHCNCNHILSGESSECQ